MAADLQRLTQRLSTLQSDLSCPELLDRASALAVAGEAKAAALDAWICLRQSDHLGVPAMNLLGQLDEWLPGLLVDDHLVWVSTSSLAAGGSWLITSPPKEPVPIAFDAGVLRFFSSVLDARQARTLVDVGANSGSFALLGRANEGLRCHAFEPNPAIAELLRRNVERNRLGRQVTVYESALSDFTGQATLAVPSQTGLSTLGDASHLRSADTVTVDAWRLDDFIEGHNIGRIDAIKLDTEGHELQVLRGARAAIERWRPVLLLEAVDQMMARHSYSRDQLVHFLTSCGYSHGSVGSEDLIAWPSGTALNTPS